MSHGDLSQETLPRALRLRALIDRVRDHEYDTPDGYRLDVLRMRRERLEAALSDTVREAERRVADAAKAERAASGDITHDELVRQARAKLADMMVGDIPREIVPAFKALADFLTEATRLEVARLAAKRGALPDPEQSARSSRVRESLGRSLRRVS